MQSQLLSQLTASAIESSRTDWLHEARWGAFAHYLAESATNLPVEQITPELWNVAVDNMDVNGLADQLASTGAGYFVLTIGQNSGYFCAPNETYDALTGIIPSKCSRRDMVSDLADALKSRGLRLMVYLGSGAPALDPVAVEKLRWEWGFDSPWGEEPGPRTNKRLAEFQHNWEAIIRDWSLRWGNKVWGWWFDGCYFAPEMYDYPDAPNYTSFAAAARAGNANSIVAFNPGIVIELLSTAEDYTAGEINDPRTVTCPGRWVDGPDGHRGQFHMLSYLGPWWLQGPPRFSDDEARDITYSITRNGGVVTWDVPIEPNGLLPVDFLNQLRAIGSGVR